MPLNFQWKRKNSEPWISRIFKTGFMSEIISDTKNIQRFLGVEPDGVFGPVTARAVWRVLNKDEESHREDAKEDKEDKAAGPMDVRSRFNLLTLDAKARDAFEQFYFLANATAATYGCSYILIGGNRTWEEQDALYAKGRALGGSRVTNARGGQSNHNFGIAGDFGVFVGKTYLDELNSEKAARVHKACSMHAAACGLEWGGSWKSITDLPHYEVVTGLSMMQKRAKFKKEGSVL
jgi:peptidoglycan LD-endopeptidase CwlK